MESTGVYWKPVFNILEDACEVILVNARHVKNVSGRKTDVKDTAPHSLQPKMMQKMLLMLPENL
jgi:transposase